MRRSVLTRARIAADRLRMPCRMVTLTYRADTWQAGDISEYLHRLRSWHARRRVRSWAYVWTAELTKRGRIHYHLLIWTPLLLPKPDLQGHWPHGLTRVEMARSPAGYIAKYTSKGTAARAFPPGARIHGARLPAPLRRLASWRLAPAWQRAISTPTDPRVPIARGWHLIGNALILSPFQGRFDPLRRILLLSPRHDRPPLPETVPPHVPKTYHDTVRRALDEYHRHSGLHHVHQNR